MSGFFLRGFFLRGFFLRGFFFGFGMSGFRSFVSGDVTHSLCAPSYLRDV